MMPSLTSWDELVAMFTTVRGVLEVEPHLLDSMAGPATHPGGACIFVGARFLASRPGSLLRRRRRRRTGLRLALRAHPSTSQAFYRTTRSLKNTAEIMPRFAVLPRPGRDFSSVVNSNRRASAWLVCHPLMTMVS
jgi:hypothetical protein